MRAWLVAVLVGAGGCPVVGAEIVTKSVAYEHDGVALEGFLAFDDAVKGRRPGVLIVHEWWGLNDYARERARQLARMGYVAFALDMYGKGVLATTAEQAGRLSSQFKGQALMRTRARAGLDVLLRDERVDPRRVVAIGYCFGGTTVLELAYSGAELAGVVSFHGGLVPARGDDLTRIRARILVCHGADDPFVPDEEVAAFQRSMKAARADWQMISYGRAVHGFTNPGVDAFKIEGARYDAAADRRAWRHLGDFLEEVCGPTEGKR